MNTPQTTVISSSESFPIDDRAATSNQADASQYSVMICANCEVKPISALCTECDSGFCQECASFLHQSREKSKHSLKYISTERIEQRLQKIREYQQLLFGRPQFKPFDDPEWKNLVDNAFHLLEPKPAVLANFENLDQAPLSDHGILHYSSQHVEYPRLFQAVIGSIRMFAPWSPRLLRYLHSHTAKDLLIAILNICDLSQSAKLLSWWCSAGLPLPLLYFASSSRSECSYRLHRGEVEEISCQRSAVLTSDAPTVLCVGGPGSVNLHKTELINTIFNVNFESYDAQSLYHKDSADIIIAGNPYAASGHPFHIIDVHGADNFENGTFDFLLPIADVCLIQVELKPKSRNFVEKIINHCRHNCQVFLIVWSNRNVSDSTCFDELGLNLLAASKDRIMLSTISNSLSMNDNLILVKNRLKPILKIICDARNREIDRIDDTKSKLFQNFPIEIANVEVTTSKDIGAKVSLACKELRSLPHNYAHFPLSHLEQRVAKVPSSYDAHIEVTNEAQKMKIREGRKEFSSPSSVVKLAMEVAEDNPSAIDSFQEILERTFKPFTDSKHAELRKLKREIGAQNPSKHQAEEMARLDQEINRSKVSLNYCIRELAERATKGNDGLEPTAKPFQDQEQCKVAATRLLYHLLNSAGPIEVVNGDTWEIPKSLLLNLFHIQERDADHHRKIIVVGIVGKENTGKSFLMNMLFHCNFDVSWGRCTRGLYATLIRLPDGDHDVLVIDTEGLLSLVRYEDISEFDRRLFLLVFASVNVLILNWMGGTDPDIVKILEIAVLCAKEIGLQDIKPVIYFLFRDMPNNAPADEYASTILQILRNACQKAVGILDCDNFRLEEVIDVEKIKTICLPPAFVEKLQSEIQTDSEFIYINPRFASKVLELRSMLLGIRSTGIRCFTLYDWLNHLCKNHEIVQSNANKLHRGSVEERYKHYVLERVVLQTRQIEVDDRFVAEMRKRLEEHDTIEELTNLSSEIDSSAELCREATLTTFRRRMQTDYSTENISSGLIAQYEDLIKNIVAKATLSIQASRLNQIEVLRQSKDVQLMMTSLKTELKKLQTQFRSSDLQTREEKFRNVAESTKRKLDRKLQFKHSEALQQVKAAYSQIVVDSGEVTGGDWRKLTENKGDDGVSEASKMLDCCLKQCDPLNNDPDEDSGVVTRIHSFISSPFLMLWEKIFGKKKPPGDKFRTMIKQLAALLQVRSREKNNVDGLVAFANIEVQKIKSQLRADERTMAHAIACELVVKVHIETLTNYREETLHRFDAQVTELLSVLSRSFNMLKSADDAARWLSSEILQLFRRKLQEAALKKLETTLGQWNDCSCQQIVENAMMRTFAANNVREVWKYLYSQKEYLLKLFDELFFTKQFDEIRRNIETESLSLANEHSIYRQEVNLLKDLAENFAVTCHRKFTCNDGSVNPPRVGELQKAFLTYVTTGTTILNENKQDKSLMFSDALRELDVVNFDDEAIEEHADNESLIDKMTRFCDALKRCCSEPFRTDIGKEHIAWMPVDEAKRSALCEKSYRSFVTCDESCPYCNQKCTVNGDHVKHSTKDHLLWAYSGFRDQTSQRAGLICCTDPNVHANYRILRGKDWYPFPQDIRKFNSNWDIVANSSRVNISLGHKVAWIGLRNGIGKEIEGFLCKFGYLDSAPAEWNTEVSKYLVMSPISPEWNQRACIENGGVRILSLSGGGLRGLVEIRLMMEIEKMTKRPIHQLFDAIYGTSTGSILAVAVGRLKMKLDEVEKGYLGLGRNIFSGSFLSKTMNMFRTGAAYSSEILENSLREYFGAETLLVPPNSVNCPYIGVVACRTSLKPPSRHVFRSYAIHSKFTPSVLCCDAVQASCSAPTYFTHKKIGRHTYVDGGLMANNPSEVALEDMVDGERGKFPGKQIDYIVSLGTGLSVLKKGHDLGIMGSMLPALKELDAGYIDILTQTDDVVRRVKNRYPKQFFHLDPPGAGDARLDDTSFMPALLDITDRYLDSAEGSKLMAELIGQMLAKTWVLVLYRNETAATLYVVSRTSCEIMLSDFSVLSSSSEESFAVTHDVENPMERLVLKPLNLIKSTSSYVVVSYKGVPISNGESFNLQPSIKALLK